MGIGIAAVAGGIRQGFKDYRDNMRAIDVEDREAKRFAMEEERAGREKTRFGWEENQEKERQRVREAEEKYRNIDKELQSGMILGADGAIQEQPAGAIAVPGAAPATKTPNPFLTGAEGRYKDPKAALDEYYTRKGAALRELYNAKGDYEKAEQVPAMMQALRQNKFMEKTGAAFAAMAAGAPGARDAMQKVYGMVADGFELDPTKGKFDPKTGSWVGLERVAQDGKREAFNLTGEQIAVMAMRYKDPGELIKFSLDSAFKKRQEGREDQKVANDTTKANAYASTALDNAATNKSTRAANDVIRARQQDGKDDEQALKTFASSFGYREIEPKTKDEIAELGPKEQELYRSARQEQSRRREAVGYASGIFSLNERKVPAAVIAQVVPTLQRRIKEGKGADGIDEKTKLPFINFNGMKILLPQD